MLDGETEERDALRAALDRYKGFCGEALCDDIERDRDTYEDAIRSHRCSLRLTIQVPADRVNERHSMEDTFVIEEEGVMNIHDDGGLVCVIMATRSSPKLDR